VLTWVPRKTPQASDPTQSNLRVTTQTIPRLCELTQSNRHNDAILRERFFFECFQPIGVFAVHPGCPETLR
jgi:hypothetical protein